MKIKSLKQKLNDITLKIKNKPFVSFVIRFVNRLGEHGVSDTAASIAYYALLSLLPVLLGIIAVLGLFLPIESVQTNLFSFFAQYLPGSDQIIAENITGIIRMRGTLGVISVIGLFWTGSAVFGSIGRAMNIAWGIRTYRPFYYRKLRDIVIALSCSITFFLSMVSSAFSAIIPVIDLPVLNSLAAILSEFLGFILMFAAVLLLYKYMPNLKLSWRRVWPGVVLCTVLFEIARIIFNTYLSGFAQFDLVYGSIAAAIVLMVWAYISAFIFISGAEFASELSQIRKKVN